MPWEKSFDLDEATDRAIEVFRKKGYEGASMSDLIAGMGINKGSLYNAFGSKKALFDRALLRFDDLNRKASLDELEALDDPLRAIAGVFDGIIADAQSDAEGKGCLVVNTAVDLPNRDEAVKAAVKESLSETADFFDRMIRSGQARNAIPADISPHDTATALMSIVLGMRVLVRGAADHATLEGIKLGAMRLVA